MKSSEIVIDTEKTLGSKVLVNRTGVNTFNNRGTVVEKGSFVEVCLMDKQRDTLMVYLPKVPFSSLNVKVDDDVVFEGLQLTPFKNNKEESFGRAEGVRAIV